MLLFMKTLTPANGGVKIKCIETNTIYYGIRECAREMNLNHSSILKVLQGKYQKAGGYTFEYVEEC